VTDDLTYQLTTHATPAAAYAAICDVRAWWSGDLTGRTDRLGEEWDYRVPGIHYSAFRTTVLEPGRTVVWRCTASELTFTEEPDEWTGTSVRFDLRAVDGGTEVTFTHEGLTPAVECFGVCEVAWGEYVLGSLRELMDTGHGRPGSYGGAEALADAQTRSAR
jgi:hypothetical protein